MARAVPPLGGLRPERRRDVFLAAHPLWSKFFADRCPHLAAMVAYYALLSLLPLLFLMLSLIGAFGTPTESSFLVRELERIVPGQSVGSLVELARSLQSNARELTVIGAVGLVWGALGFLSALESALNIVYGVANRAFVRQKAFLFLLVGGGLAAVFASLIAATTAQALLDRTAPDVVQLTVWRVGIALLASTVVTFAFLFVVYRYVPNTELPAREVLPGTVVATVLLQLSFQILPTYLRVSEQLPALKAFGGTVVLLVWLYLMGNILLLGAEVNWWWGRGRELRRSAVVGEEDEESLGHS